MDHLLARLSTLNYDLFGLLLPGLIFLIMFALWLVGAGDLVPLISSDFFPKITLTNFAATLESIKVRTGIGIAAPLLLGTYFAGHLLNWVGTKGKPDDALRKLALKRILYALRFRILRPAMSYDSSLENLFQAAQTKFAQPGARLSWQEFYPVAKSFLTRNLNNSLVSTYQNKYTLHRSLTAAAALTFWLTVASIVIGLFTVHLLGVGPRWVPLGSLGVACILIVWGFSDSYAYNWLLFGNTVVTETYALLFAPSQ